MKCYATRSDKIELAHVLDSTAIIPVAWLCYNNWCSRQSSNIVHRSKNKYFNLKMSDWLVVGLAGVTCSGKTSLSNKIHTKLSDSVIINQDDYFLPTDSPQHTFIPELNHINFDIMSSLDMQKMHRDVLNVLRDRKLENEYDGSSATKKVLIIEGFLIFGYKPIYDLCDLRYFITLNKEVCWERRKIRTYEPPDVPRYFDKIVWPEYLKHKSEILDDKDSDRGIKLIDGLRSKEDIFEQVFSEIKTLLEDNHPSGDLSVISSSLS